MTPQAAAQLLKVSIDIDKAQLKKLYKQLVLKFHPDRNKSDNAHDVFIQIKEAYETLLKYTPQVILQHLKFEASDYNNTVSTTTSSPIFTINFY